MYPFSLIIFFFYSSSIWYQSIDNGISETNEDFENSIKKTKIVLTGEVHFNSSSPVNKYNFITYLNQHHNFTQVLIEFGYAEGFLLTKYLETGDSSFILHNTLYPSEDYRKMWKNLYQYNQSQPEEKRLTVIGIDFERQRPAIQAIEFLIQSLNINQEFEEQLLALRNIKKEEKTWNPTEETIRIFQIINSQLKQDKFTYLNENPNFKHLKLILGNSASHLRMTDRNKDFVKNLSKVYDPKEKYFGQFGGVHIRLEKKFTFASQLIDNFQDLNKSNVVIIPTRYYNAFNASSDGNRKITGGGYNFTINDKESVFEIEFGSKVNDGIYLLDVDKMPDKLAKKVPKGYSYMLYVKGTRSLKWGRQ